MNNIVLIGRLGKDPEVKYTQAQQKFCTFPLAVSGRNDHTDWFRVQCWERQAELAQQYLAKGSQVAVQGYIRTGEYTNNEGVKQRSFDIVVNRLQFLGGKRDQATGGGQVQTSQFKQTADEPDLDMIPF